METWIIILINGIISGIFSFIGYRQSRKTNKRDFINNQISIIEKGIDSVRDKTYELYRHIFVEEENLDENIDYRLLSQKVDNLQSKILVNKNFIELEDLVADFNIFSINVVESEDINLAKINLNIFDDSYQDFKKELYKIENKLNI